MKSLLLWIFLLSSANGDQWMSGSDIGRPGTIANHNYYRASGQGEYLERGVAALRAQFPISPSEYWAHGGYGPKVGVSSFHWRTGSGLAGVEIEEDYLHNAIVDLGVGCGVGVNGLDLNPMQP
jgi:hypothetical protein